MNAVILKNNINIENLIYEVRGVQVMLDSDLARLYECTNGTKDINKAVKRNLERFPENFMFRLTDGEYNALRFQIGTSNIKGGRRYNPYVFTEQGVAMLSSVLHSETAINMSIKIINAFVMMRKYVSTNILEQKYINNMVLEDHDKIRALEDSFQKFPERFSFVLTDKEMSDLRSKKMTSNIKILGMLCVIKSSVSFIFT